MKATYDILAPLFVYNLEGREGVQGGQGGREGGRKGTLSLHVWRPHHHDVEGEVSKERCLANCPPLYTATLKSWVLQSIPQGCLSHSE